MLYETKYMMIPVSCHGSEESNRLKEHGMDWFDLVIRVNFLLESMLINENIYILFYFQLNIHVNLTHPNPIEIVGTMPTLTA